MPTIPGNDSPTRIFRMNFHDSDDFRNPQNAPKTRPRSLFGWGLDGTDSLTDEAAVYGSGFSATSTVTSVTTFCSSGIRLTGNVSHQPSKPFFGGA